MIYAAVENRQSTFTYLNSEPIFLLAITISLHLAFLINSNILKGASLTDKPLSLRPYMSHITLRSTICHIIVKASKIMQGFTILDPMCGSGSILLEAAMCIKWGEIRGREEVLVTEKLPVELNIIACDIDSNTLLSAQCNLREIGQASIILSDTSSIPLLSNSVDAVICDFPFGQKHTTSKPYQSLLIKMIRESKRVLRPSSRLVILVSTVQHIFLKNNIHQVPGIELLDNYPVSLGLTPAIVMF
ncbi:THUMP domain-containing protein 2 [Armadillidium nasatum]|uniref:THUMP domain-containing protein 2 n=1 Tax=Armadillidium nasatum TaxID=96803 RepID=A0A5N5SRM6_9CRUS|nr:THUMP domain-containing protein 2 [Armadillidium nasatum]